MFDFNLIKGRIRRYSRSSQVGECLHILLDVQRAEQKNYPFWHALVLLKWILIHTNDSPLRQAANRQDVLDTLKLIEQFEGDLHVIEFSKGIERGFRIIAYQQFWAQDGIGIDTFDRQLALYKNINRISINEDFTALTGMSVVDFINLLYVTYIFLVAHRATPGTIYTGVLEQNYQILTDKYFGRALTTKFVKLLTLTNFEDLNSMQKMSNEAYQLYETSFWSLKPFLIINRMPMTPHVAVFKESARHFIYDFLKSKSPRFTEEFGHVVEDYVELGLKEMKARYLTESQLKQEYPHLKKTCDYLVNDNLLIEAKAIELQPRSAIIRSQGLLTSDLKSSIVKSYIQLIATANTIDPSREWYGIVITYKEMYIGFGASAWSEFLKDRVEKFLKESGISINPLPPANLCFINLEDWDSIVQNVKSGKASLQTILKTALEMNATPDITKGILFFEQAIRLHYPVKHFDLSYLTEANKLLFNPSTHG